MLRIVLGWHLWTGTKALPDGSRVPTYEDRVRRHGRTIFFLGALVFLVVLVVRIMTELWF